MQETRNLAKTFALIVGVTYLVIGLVGFAVTGFEGIVQNGPDDLIGFDLNPFHNVVHLGIGLILLIAALVPDPSITEGVLIAGGLVYILAAALGFLNELQILSIDDELAADNFLHVFSGIAAFLVGVISAKQSSARMASA